MRVKKDCFATTPIKDANKLSCCLDIWSGFCTSAGQIVKEFRQTAKG